MGRRHCDSDVVVLVSIILQFLSHYIKLMRHLLKEARKNHFNWIKVQTWLDIILLFALFLNPVLGHDTDRSRGSQSEASTEVTWSVWTNQRPGSAERERGDWRGVWSMSFRGNQGDHGRWLNHRGVTKNPHPEKWLRNCSITKMLLQYIVPEVVDFS